MAHPDWDGKTEGPSWRVEKYFGPINKDAPKKKFNEWSTGWIIFVIVFGALLLFSTIWSASPEGKRALENSDRIRYSEELQRKKADMLFEAEQAARRKVWSREQR